MSLTFAGRNLGTWTKYKGLDPEINENGGLNFTDRRIPQPAACSHVHRAHGRSLVTGDHNQSEMPIMHTNRDKLYGRRIWLVIAAGALFVSACNTDQFLKATDPDNTPPGALTGPSSLPGYRASAIGDFGLAFDGNALESGRQRVRRDSST